MNDQALEYVPPAPDYVPTFSHQELPSRVEHEDSRMKPTLAPPPSVVGVVIAAALPLESSAVFAADEPDISGLQEVRRQLPENVRFVKRLALRDRVQDRFHQLMDSWNWDGPNLLMLGGTGAGKTSACAYLVRRMLAEALPVVTFSPGWRRFWGGCSSTLERASLIRWQSCRELAEAMREHALGKGEPEAIIRCQNARLLVLDDVGATDSPVAYERILNVRYERGWPTITTSGLTSRELTSSLNEALVRRMLQRKGRDGLIVSMFPPQRK